MSGDVSPEERQARQMEALAAAVERQVTAMNRLVEVRREHNRTMRRIYRWPLAVGHWLRRRW